MRYGILLFITILVLGACSEVQPQNQDTTHKKEQIQPSDKTILPKIDHIVIVVEENHSQKKIYGNPSAPYINYLMKNGANLMNYYAIEHPSQPNYLDLFSGSNQGVTYDSIPKIKFTAKNLASELIEKNYTFVGYSEGLPSIGFNGGSTGPGGYARKHNPWVNFTNVPNETNKRLDDFPSDFSQLPTVSFVIPTLQHDMHDGTVQEGDLWLKQHMGSYVQWAKDYNSLLIVTWDEDDFSQNNKIPAFFVGKMVKTGEFNEKANHYNLLRTIEDIYGLSHAGLSGQVSSIKSIWK